MPRRASSSLCVGSRVVTWSQGIYQKRPRWCGRCSGKPWSWLSCSDTDTSHGLIDDFRPRPTTISIGTQITAVSRSTIARLAKNMLFGVRSDGVRMTLALTRTLPVPIARTTTVSNARNPMTWAGVKHLCPKHSAGPTVEVTLILLFTYLLELFKLQKYVWITSFKTGFIVNDEEDWSCLNTDNDGLNFPVVKIHQR